jgi:hypothetical protein
MRGFWQRRSRSAAEDNVGTFAYYPESYVGLPLADSLPLQRASADSMIVEESLNSVEDQ